MPTDSEPDINIDLQTLRIARAIAVTGSITGAARMLGTTQPAISQHIQRAERRLSMSLIVRHGRTIELTDVGILLSQHATGVLDALQAASSDIAGMANLRSGRVRMVGFPSASSTLIPHLISTMRDRHRGLTVHYTEAEPPEAGDMVASGECDLALAFAYPGESGAHHPDAPRGLVSIDLFLDPLFVLLSHKHPLVDQPSIDIADLEDDAWIAGCPRCSTHLVRACQDAGYEPNIVYETDNATATIGMVAQDLGIALLPRLALGTALLPSTVKVKKLTGEITRTISVLVPEEKLTLPAVSALMSSIASIDGSTWRLRPARLPSAPRHIMPRVASMTAGDRS
jgi:DNA-binding transcriptional LysR family regulator